MVAYLIIKLCFGAMTEQQKNIYAVSWEKLATFSLLKRSQVFQGIFTMVAGLCGTFLFCLTDADPDEGSSKSLAKSSELATIGALGGLCAATVMILTMQNLLRRIEEDEEETASTTETTSTETKKTIGDENIEIVTEFHDIWVRLSVFATTLLTILYGGFAIGPTQFLWESYAHIILPSVVLIYLANFFCRPLRRDSQYKRNHFFHFCQLAVLCEILGCIGNLRRKDIPKAIFGVVRMLIFPCLFSLGLKVRSTIAELPMVELSTFLVQTLLVRVFACLSAQVFFTFEVISCWMENMDDQRKCENTEMAAVSLSSFLILITGLTILRRAGSKCVREALMVTKEQVRWSEDWSEVTAKALYRINILHN